MSTLVIPSFNQDCLFEIYFGWCSSFRCWLEKMEGMFSSSSIWFRNWSVFQKKKRSMLLLLFESAVNRFSKIEIFVWIWIIQPPNTYAFTIVLLASLAHQIIDILVFIHTPPWQLLRALHYTINQRTESALPNLLRIQKTHTVILNGKDIIPVDQFVAANVRNTASDDRMFKIICTTLQNLCVIGKGIFGECSSLDIQNGKTMQIRDEQFLFWKPAQCLHLGIILRKRSNLLRLRRKFKRCVTRKLKKYPSRP